jgi:hypothetical protein
MMARLNLPRSGLLEQGHPAERKKRAPADARRYLLTNISER